jgi:hypothetical protein
MGSLTSIILLAVVVGGGTYCLFEFEILDSRMFESGHSYDELTNGKLGTASLNAVDMPWDYRDLERNFDSNNGRVIFVQGTVGLGSSDNLISLMEVSGYNRTSTSDRMTLKISNNSICTKVWGYENIAIDCDNILKDDMVLGYVETAGLASSENGASFPKVIIINLHCSTC